MEQLLGIDFGTVRIGLAVSDALGMLAHPLETIHVKKSGGDPFDRIAAVVTERTITRIVLGLPLRLDGSAGSAAARVERFKRRLEKRLPDVPVTTIDEALTTVAAQELLHAAGRNVKRSRPVIDQAAAVLILQEYMDLNPIDPSGEICHRERDGNGL